MKTRKKLMKALLAPVAMVLSFLIMFSFLSSNLYASALSEVTSGQHDRFVKADLLILGFRSVEGHRLLNVFSTNISELQRVALADSEYGFSEFSSEDMSRGLVPVDLSIYRIVELRDFAGNLYILVELFPTGYMIFHNDSGAFVERSATVPSPFAGLYGDLYYGGFSQYFYRNEDGNLMHTLTRYVVLAYVAEANNWDAHSSEIAEDFLAYADIAVLDYIAYGTIAVQSMNVPTVWTNVNDFVFIRNQTTVNNMGGHCPVADEFRGYCLYVALATLIGYFDHVSANRGMRIINNSSFVTNRHTANAMIQQAFVTHLRDVVGYSQLGLGFAINITNTRNVGRRYFENRGVWNRITDELRTTAADATNARISANIRNSRPVVIVGIGLPGIGEKDIHAVVGYGFRNEANGAFTVRVNYGWGTGDVAGFSRRDVWVTGFNWDGLLTFTLTP